MSILLPRDNNGVFCRGANLEAINLSGQDLQNANFRQAKLNYACFDNADLRGANFYYAQLSGASFRGANLEDADLDSDLSGANLTNANLTNANLTNANLRGARLTGAILTGTCLYVEEDVCMKHVAGFVAIYLQDDYAIYNLEEDKPRLSLRTTTMSPLPVNFFNAIKHHPQLENYKRIIANAKRHFGLNED